MNAQANPHIRYRVEDGIVHLILSKPPANEMTAAFFDELSEMTERIGKDSHTKGIIISGVGRHFSSGAALDELLAMISAEPCPGERSDIGPPFLLRNHRMLSFFEDAPFPTVAAVRGVCLGSAFELALLCHFRICSEDAVFGLPESTFNLMPGLGGIRRIDGLSGKAAALELSLGGRTFPAAEALERGLVDAIVPKKALHAEAVRLVRSVCRNYRKEKRVLYKTRYLSHHVPFEDKAV